MTPHTEIIRLCHAKEPVTIFFLQPLPAPLRDPGAMGSPAKAQPIFCNIQKQKIWQWLARSVEICGGVGEIWPYLSDSSFKYVSQLICEYLERDYAWEHTPLSPLVGFTVLHGDKTHMQTLVNGMQQRVFAQPWSIASWGTKIFVFKYSLFHAYWTLGCSQDSWGSLKHTLGLEGALPSWTSSHTFWLACYS